MTDKFRWSITVLTIPSREEYLKKLIESIENTGIAGRAELVVVYNQPAKEDKDIVEARIANFSDRLPVSVYFNNREPTIASGRNLQLTVCKSPLICFLDDDLTLHGELFLNLEEKLRRKAVGLVGVPSFVEDTDKRFKPRDTTPSVEYDGIRYMPVQGMLAAGFRDLIADLGGFNSRREFWGEWTELNLRLWRHGIPTGYAMDAGFLRHWHQAPESPTRNLSGKEKHVLWGLICTALEYEAVDANAASETFWNLVEERYLAYSFGDSLSPKNLLRTMLGLMPRITAEWSAINKTREEAVHDPFQFKPFQPLSLKDVKQVVRYAAKPLRHYRASIREWKEKDFWHLLGEILRKIVSLFRKSGVPRIKGNGQS